MSSDAGKLGCMEALEVGKLGRSEVSEDDALRSSVVGKLGSWEVGHLGILEVGKFVP